jgi:hypothetical protein
VKNDELLQNLSHKKRTQGLDMVGQIRSGKPVIGLENGAYTPFLEGKGDKIVFCGFCGKEIVNPRKEKGEIVQKFCKRICKDRFHNLNRVILVKQLLNFLSKSGFLMIPANVERREKP